MRVEGRGVGGMDKSGGKGKRDGKGGRKVDKVDG